MGCLPFSWQHDVFDHVQLVVQCNPRLFFLIYVVKWLPSQWLLIMYLFQFKHEPCSCPDQIAFCDSFQGHFFSCQYNFNLSAPSQQRVSSSCSSVSLLVPLLSSYSMSTFLQQTKQLGCTSIICLFSLLLSKDYGPSTWKPAIPREWHGFWSSMCPHTKTWLTQESSLFRGIKNSSSRTNSTTYLRWSVFENDGDALIVSDTSLFAKILVTPVIL